MERTALVTARRRKHWTQQQASVRLGIDAKTLSRWERGVATPRGYNILQLCEVYGATAMDLGLDDLQSANNPSISSTPPATQDLTLRFMTILCTWPQHYLHHDELQRCIAQATEDITVYHDDPISRREALRRLALLPVEISGLTAHTAVLKRPPEEFLTHCAAGITACEYLSQGTDLPLAFSIVSVYVPTLSAIMRDSSKYRQAAARLATQCLFLKGVLGSHIEGKQQAMRYSQEAVTFSEETGDLGLRITARGRLAWTLSVGRQHRLALDQALQAHALFEHERKRPDGLASYVYGVLSKYQALNGMKDDALQSLRQAHSAFFQEDEVHTYMDHDLSNFLLDDGTTHIYTGAYEQAIDTLSQVIDPENLTTKIPVAERIRIEVLNYHTLASLKRQKKDRDQTIFLWKAAMTGAIRLQSEQRFAEACANFDMMEAVWAGDTHIQELHELAVHW